MLQYVVVGVVEMDINERISSLTESEAKAALVNLVNYAGAMAVCGRCILNPECNASPAEVDCKKNFLEWALESD